MGGRAILAPLTAVRRRLAGALGLLALLIALGPGASPLSAGAGGGRFRHHRSNPATDEGAVLTDRAERREVQKTLELIHAGGPFRHRQDGVVFGNREGRLPARPRGYYHEYTVETPGSPDRGARRIIRGGGGEIYYTRDHYRTFLKIDPETLR